MSVPLEVQRARFTIQAIERLLIDRPNLDQLPDRMHLINRARAIIHRYEMALVDRELQELEEISRRERELYHSRDDGFIVGDK